MYFIAIAALSILVAILFRRTSELEQRLTRIAGTPAFVPEQPPGTATGTGGKHAPSENVQFAVEPAYQKLVPYVQEQLSRNIPAPEIVQKLVAVGWDEEKVLDLVARASGTPEAQIAAAPITRTAHVIKDARVSATRATHTFIDWLKEDWIMKLGGFFVLVGFGWLVTHAFINNWIGPVGRITLGVAAGLTVLALGEWRTRNFPRQGGFILATGSAIVLVSLYAGRIYYDFFTAGSTLAMMFFVVALVSLSSIKHRLEPLAILALAAGYFIPFLTGSPEFNFISLFSYLFVITVGVLWVVWVTGWRRLIVLSALSMLVYSALIPWHTIARTYLDETAVFSIPSLFAFAFTLLYFVTTLLGIARKGNRQREDIISAALAGIFLITWIVLTIPEVWQSLIAAGWALVFAVGAFIGFRATNNQYAFYVYGGVAGVLVGIATALELEGAALAIASILEVLFVILALSYLLPQTRIAERMGVFISIPIVLSFEAMGLLSRMSWGTSDLLEAVMNRNSLVLILLIAACAIIGTRYRMREEEDPSGKPFRATQSAVFFTLAALYAVAYLWLVLHAALTPGIATTAALLVYTITGIVLYAVGKFGEKRGMVLAGQALITMVSLRLLVVDIWMLPITQRIIAFIAIGALLMSTAFLVIHKKKP